MSRERPQAEQLALLDLIANDPLRPEWEFTLFVFTLRACADPRGLVSQNDVRNALSNHHGLIVEPHRYSAFWHRARSAGLIAEAGFDLTDQRPSGNGGKPQRRYRLIER